MSTERTRCRIALAARASDHHAVVQALGDEHVGLEAHTHVDGHANVKIWLRLLAYNTQIEQQIRQRLYTRFSATLPRLDYPAQLDHHPGGLRIDMLPHYLMVTGGNVTGLTDQLEKEGLVRHEADLDDRRSFRVLLTDADRRHFAEMTAEHERWLTEMLNGLDVASKDALYAQLSHLRVHLAQREQELDTHENQP